MRLLTSQHLAMISLQTVTAGKDTTVPGCYAPYAKQQSTQYFQLIQKTRKRVVAFLFSSLFAKSNKLQAHLNSRRKEAQGTHKKAICFMHNDAWSIGRPGKHCQLIAIAHEDHGDAPIP